MPASPMKPFSRIPSWSLMRLPKPALPGFPGELSSTSILTEPAIEHCQDTNSSSFPAIEVFSHAARFYLIM